METKNQYLKSGLIYVIGDMIAKALAFISFPILTRYLKPADYGIVHYVNAITTFLLVLCLLNLNTYYLVQYNKLPTEEDRKKLFGNLTLFIAFYNTLIVIVCCLVGITCEGVAYSKVSFFPYVFIGILANFFDVFSCLPLATFRMKQQAVLFTMINVSKNALQLGLTVFLVVYCGMLSLGALYGILFGSIFFFFLFLFLTIKASVFQIDISQLKRALAFSLPLVPGAIAYRVINLLDRILLEKYASLSDLGIFGTASSLGLMINIIALAFYQAFEPQIFKTYGKEGFMAEFYRIKKYLLFLLMISSLAVALYAQDFFFFMSRSEFHQAYKYVPLILLGGVCSGMNLLYATIITAKGEIKVNSMVIVIGCIMSFSLNLLLIPVIHLWGASLAFFLSFAFILSISIYKSHFPGFIFRELMVLAFWLIVVYVFNYHLKIYVNFTEMAIKALVLLFFLAFSFKVLSIHEPAKS